MAKKKTPGSRDPIAYDLRTTPKYRKRVEKSEVEKAQKKDAWSKKAKHKKPPIEEALSDRESKRLRKLAYTAIERDTLSVDAEVAAKADKAFDAWSDHSMSEKELRHWATREVEYRTMNESPNTLAEFYQVGDKVEVIKGPLRAVLDKAEKLAQKKKSEKGIEPNEKKKDKDEHAIVRDPDGPANTIGITIDGEYHLVDEEDVELIFESCREDDYEDLTEWSYAETTSGIRVPISSEEQEILNKCGSPLRKRNMDDREQEVARRMVSRGVLHRRKDDEGIYFVRDNQKLTRF